MKRAPKKIPLDAAKILLKAEWHERMALAAFLLAKPGTKNYRGAASALVQAVKLRGRAENAIFRLHKTG